MIGLPDGWVGEGGGAENPRKYGLPRNADGILNDHMFPSNPNLCQTFCIFRQILLIVFNFPSFHRPRRSIQFLCKIFNNLSYEKALYFIIRKKKNVSIDSQYYVEKKEKIQLQGLDSSDIEERSFVTYIFLE